MLRGLSCEPPGSEWQRQGTRGPPAARSRAQHRPGSRLRRACRPYVVNSVVRLLQLSGMPPVKVPLLTHLRAQSHSACGRRAATCSKQQAASSKQHAEAVLPKQAARPARSHLVHVREHRPFGGQGAGQQVVLDLAAAARAGGRRGIASRSWRRRAHHPGGFGAAGARARAAHMVTQLVITLHEAGRVPVRLFRLMFLAAGAGGGHELQWPGPSAPSLGRHCSGWRGLDPGGQGKDGLHSVQRRQRRQLVWQVAAQLLLVQDPAAAAAAAAAAASGLLS